MTPTTTLTTTPTTTPTPTPTPTPSLVKTSLKFADPLNCKKRELNTHLFLFAASIAPPSGVDLPVDVKENGDRTYTIEYVPEKPGCHIVDIKYGGEGVPRSPFRVHVKPSCDASKVGVDGLGPGDTFTVGKESDVTVDTTKAGKGEMCRDRDLINISYGKKSVKELWSRQIIPGNRPYLYSW